MSVKDLKAIGLKTQRIIATGSNIPIVIYSSSIDSNGSGGVTDSNLLSSVGSDTFLFVSGSKDSKDKNTKGVSLFGGDVVVSGTLYAERQVIEVDQTSPGALFVSGNLEVTGTTLLNSNRTNNTELVLVRLTKNMLLDLDQIMKQFISCQAELLLIIMKLNIKTQTFL